jgi:hypothetical protein
VLVEDCCGGKAGRATGCDVVAMVDGNMVLLGFILFFLYLRSKGEVELVGGLSGCSMEGGA